MAGVAATGRERPAGAFPSSRIAACGLALALASGPLAALPLALLLALVAALAMALAVALRPALGAYTLLATTPLLAGIDRGRLLPGLRPSEAVLGVVGSGLALRGWVGLLRGASWRPRWATLEVSLAVFVLTGSVVPLLWMVARGREITMDDLSYASYLWKYAAVFAFIRCAVRTEPEVRRSLWVVLASAVVVAAVAIPQSLRVLGVPQLLATYWSPSEGQASLSAARGTSTLSSSFAVADMMAFSLAVAAGLMRRGAPHRRLLLATAGVLAFGALAAGQFSGFIGLLVAIVTVGLVLRRMGRLVLAAIPAAAIATVVLWPVLAQRLGDADPATGLPRSWVGANGRWSNLTTYFWPDLFRDWNWLTGVRVAARVPAPEVWRDWVWIESGHTWLLWSGGLPFLLACLAFLAVAIRRVAPIARHRRDSIGAAALGALAALWVNVVLMTFDVHLTLRGSADLLFALLALALTGAPRRTSASTVATYRRP
jgi:hypothetical protein